MFEPVLSFLNAGTTGVFVSVVIGLNAYLRDRMKSTQEATITDYREWLRRKENRKLLDGQRELLAALEAGDETTKVVEEYLLQVMSLLRSHTNILDAIEAKFEHLPNIDKKLDLILEQFAMIQQPSRAQDQLAVSVRVLDALATGLQGAGVRVMMQHKPDASPEGTIMTVWKLGTQSPHMMLVDYVGGIRANRLSLIVNNDESLTLRAYDSLGKESQITSPTYAPAESLVAFTAWKNREVSFWVNGEKHGSVTMEQKFEYLGPLLLFGMDIEGTLSADAVRWQPSAESPCLNFQKNGIWHESRFDTAAFWERVLNEQEISELTEDPWCMLRPPQT